MRSAADGRPCGDRRFRSPDAADSLAGPQTSIKAEVRVVVPPRWSRRRLAALKASEAGVLERRQAELPMVWTMTTWDDVRRIAMALPETVEQPGDALQWRVGDKLFAWDRPLRRADLDALGDAAPDGPVLAARVPDLGAKDALLADDARVYFTTPHFNGYPAILVRLDLIALAELKELLVEAWLTRAPRRVAKAYLSQID